MPIKIIDRGQNNTLNISEEFIATQNGAIVVRGSNCVVTIGEHVRAKAIDFWVGNNSVVNIGDGVNLGALRVHQAYDCKLSIGATTGFVWAAFIDMHEPATVEIGVGCIIASDVWMTVSDQHPIYDLTTDERLNPAKPISIADKVWIGTRSIVLKGTTIEHGSVIGAMSTVTGRIPANCVAAGSPARVVRENVRWDTRLPHYK